MTRRPIVAGNWKLNNNLKQASEIVTLLMRNLSDVTDVDIVVCPVFTALVPVCDVLLETNIAVGAQDLYWEAGGAFTGEVSAPLIKDAGAQYVIIGHSERRQFFGETNASVNKKMKAALAHALTPIVCVGENLAEREAVRTFEVVRVQCEESLAGLMPAEMEKIVIAYEPVWAIGTGRTATPDQAQEVHQMIRRLLQRMFSEETAQKVRIQYGGSVNAENISALITQPDIDGALVGGASLKADVFTKIVRSSSGLKK